jgi:aspartyl-tRNA(Asn)/glutamyl-tRNA(Gln) amidotransferase subunit A
MADCGLQRPSRDGHFLVRTTPPRATLKPMHPIAFQDSIEALAARAQGGQLRCERLVQDVFAAASESKAAHVFTALYQEAALASARGADQARAAGVVLPALAGLPVTIKDLFDVAGQTTLAGSVVWRGRPAALADAPAVARLRREGAAIIGRTNMTEFAFSGIGINPHYGTPRNPTDTQTDRIPGGSSSGAAVSVALGLAVAALGSDTGGSVRIPAALCGLVGFKNTQHRVPREGAAELSRTLDTVGAITRSVRDALLVDGVLSGSPLAVRERSVRSLRLAIPRTLMFDALEPAVAHAFDRAARTLSQAGAQLIEIDLSELGELAQINTPAGFSSMECYALHRELLQTRRAEYDPRVVPRIELGALASAADYLTLQDRRRDWIARVERRLAGFDALLCPTVPIVAPAIRPLVESDEAFQRNNLLILRNTAPINFLDGCSFSLPCHAPGEPSVGLMLSSVRGDDAPLASVALAVESELKAALG